MRVRTSAPVNLRKEDIVYTPTSSHAGGGSFPDASEAQAPPANIPVFKGPDPPTSLIRLVLQGGFAWVIPHKYEQYYASPRDPAIAGSSKKRWQRHIIPRLQGLAAWHTVGLMGWNTYDAWQHPEGTGWKVSAYGSSDQTMGSFRRDEVLTCTSDIGLCPAATGSSSAEDPGWVAKLFFYGRLSVSFAIILICFHFFVLFERKKDDIPKEGSTEAQPHRPLAAWEKRREAVAGTNYFIVIGGPIAAFLCKFTWCSSVRDKQWGKHHLGLCPARLSLRKRDRGPLYSWILVVGFLILQWGSYWLGLNTMPNYMKDLDDGFGVFAATLWLICASWSTHHWKESSRAKIRSSVSPKESESAVEAWLPKQMKSVVKGNYAQRNAHHRGWWAPLDKLFFGPMHGISQGGKRVAAALKSKGDV